MRGCRSINSVSGGCSKRMAPTLVELLFKGLTYYAVHEVLSMRRLFNRAVAFPNDKADQLLIPKAANRAVTA